MNIEHIEKCVKATLAIESLAPSAYGEKTTHEFLSGRITSSIAIERIKKYHLEKHYRIIEKEFEFMRKIKIFNFYMYCAIKTLDIELSKYFNKKAYEVLVNITKIRKEIQLMREEKSIE